MVEKIFEDKKTLYNKYKSSKKLKLKGIKYFTNPIVAKDSICKFEFYKEF